MSIFKRITFQAFVDLSPDHFEKKKKTKKKKTQKNNKQTTQ